jgi:hypothetical protein
MGKQRISVIIVVVSALVAVSPAAAETDEREIGMLTLGRGSDIRDLDFP